MGTLVWSSSPAAQGPTVSPTSQTTGIVTLAPGASTPAPIVSPSSVPTNSPVASTLAPIVSPSSVPTSSPVSGTIDEQCASETDGDSTEVRYWADCGRVGRCGNQITGGFNYDVPHEVRCCSDTSKPGRQKRNGCSVWANSNMDDVCYSAKNFLEAECICGKHDARLCTREEIEGNCSRGTGCGFDRQVAWTSTEEEESPI